MKRRIVFDTSTLIGAALRKGSLPYHALILAVEDYEVCASEELIGEVSRVLLSAKFERYLPQTDRVAFVEFFKGHSCIHELQQERSQALQPRCRDAKDDYLLLLAQSARADTIVTSDEDLLVLNPWNGIAILRSTQFLERESRRTNREVSSEDVP